MTSKRIHAYTLLLLVSLIWGIATPVIKFTLSNIDPISFLTYRFFLASTVGIILLFPTFKHHLQKLKKSSFQIVTYSVLATTFALGFLFLGIEKTTVLDVILITAVSPLVTAFMGSILLKERITKREKIGISIAFLGTIVTILEPMLKDGFEISKLTGNLLVVGYLVANGYSAILAKKLTRKGISAFSLSNMSFVIGFLTILPISLYLAPASATLQTITTLEFPYHLGVLYMALISGTTAYALFIKGQKSIEVSEAGVFSYLNPLFSAPLAVFWLGEKISLPFVFGGIIIATGVVIAEMKKKK